MDNPFDSEDSDFDGNPFESSPSGGFQGPGPSRPPLAMGGRAPGLLKGVSRQVLDVVASLTLLSPVFEAGPDKIQREVDAASLLADGIDLVEDFRDVLGATDDDIRQSTQRIAAFAHQIRSALQQHDGGADSYWRTAFPNLEAFCKASSAALFDLSLQIMLFETHAAFPPDPPPKRGLFALCMKKPPVDESLAPIWERHSILAVIRGEGVALASEPRAIEVPVESMRAAQAIAAQGGKPPLPEILRVRFRTKGSRFIPVATDAAPVTLELYVNEGTTLPPAHPLSGVAEDACSLPEAPKDVKGQPVVDKTLPDVTALIPATAEAAAVSPERSLGRLMARATITPEIMRVQGESRVDLLASTSARAATSARRSNARRRRKPPSAAAQAAADAAAMPIGQMKLWNALLPIGAAPSSEGARQVAALLSPQTARSVLEGLMIAGFESNRSGRLPSTFLLKRASANAPPEWRPFLPPAFSGVILMFGALTGVTIAQMTSMLLRVSVRDDYWSDAVLALDARAELVQSLLSHLKKKVDPQTSGEIYQTFDALKERACAILSGLYTRAATLSAQLRIPIYGAPGSPVDDLLTSVGPILRLLSLLGFHDGYGLVVQAVTSDMRRVTEQSLAQAGTDAYQHVRRLAALVEYASTIAMDIDHRIEEECAGHVPAFVDHVVRGSITRYSLIAQILGSILPAMRPGTPLTTAATLSYNTELKALESGLIRFHDRLFQLGFSFAGAGRRPPEGSTAILVDLSPHFLPCIKVWLDQLPALFSEWVENTVKREAMGGWRSVGTDMTMRDQNFSHSVVDLVLLLESSLQEAIARVDVLTAVRGEGSLEMRDHAAAGQIVFLHEDESERAWTIHRLELLYDALEAPFAGAFEKFGQRLEEAAQDELKSKFGCSKQIGTILGSLRQLEFKVQEVREVLESWVTALLHRAEDAEDADVLATPKGKKPRSKQRPVVRPVPKKRDADDASDVSDLSDISLVEMEEQDIESIAMSNPLYSSTLSSDLQDNPLAQGDGLQLPAARSAAQDAELQRLMLQSLGRRLDEVAATAFERLTRVLSRLGMTVAAATLARVDDILDSTAEKSARAKAREEMIKEEAKSQESSMLRLVNWGKMKAAGISAAVQRKPEQKEETEDVFVPLTSFLDEQIWTWFSAATPDAFLVGLKVLFQATMDAFEEDLLTRTSLKPSDLRVLEEALSILVDWYHGEGLGIDEEQIYEMSVRAGWLVETAGLPSPTLVHIYYRTKEEHRKLLAGGEVVAPTVPAAPARRPMKDPLETSPRASGSGRNALLGTGARSSSSRNDRPAANRRGPSGEEPLVRAGPDGSLLSFKRSGTRQRAQAADAFAAAAVASAPPAPGPRRPPPPPSAPPRPSAAVMDPAANPFEDDPSANPFEEPEAFANPFGEDVVDDSNPFGAADLGPRPPPPSKQSSGRAANGEKKVRRAPPPPRSPAADNPFLEEEEPGLAPEDNPFLSAPFVAAPPAPTGAPRAPAPKPVLRMTRPKEFPEMIESDDDTASMVSSTYTSSRASIVNGQRRPAASSRLKNPDEVRAVAAALALTVGDSFSVVRSSALDPEIEDRVSEIKTLRLLRPTTLLFLLRLISSRGEPSSDFFKRENAEVSILTAWEQMGLAIDASIVRDRLLLSLPCCSVSEDGLITRGIVMLTSQYIGFSALGCASSQLASLVQLPTVKLTGLKRRHQRRIAADPQVDGVTGFKERWAIKIDQLATIDKYEPTEGTEQGMPTLLLTLDISNLGLFPEAVVHAALAARQAGRALPSAQHRPLRRLMGFQGVGLELLYAGVLRLCTLPRGVQWPVRAHVFRVRERVNAAMPVRIPGDIDKQLGVCLTGSYCAKRTTSNKMATKPGVLFVGSHLFLFESVECARKAVRWESISEVMLNDSLIHGLSLKIRSPDIDRRGKVTLVQFLDQPVALAAHQVQQMVANGEEAPDFAAERANRCYRMFQLVSGLKTLVQDIQALPQ